jgi:hypothetical protein
MKTASLQHLILSISIVLSISCLSPSKLRGASWDPVAADYAGHKGKTLHVSKLGDNSDGSSWQKAFHTIQAAMNAVPDNQGGHRILVRPDRYVEANLLPTHTGAKGSYNLIVGDHNGALGSGGQGWVLVDSSDPDRGFKSENYWSPIYGASPEMPWAKQKEPGCRKWDRWIVRCLYLTGSDAGLFWEVGNVGDNAVDCTVVVEDSVGIGRAFGGGMCYCTTNRPDEPSLFRRCYMMALDFDSDAGAVLIGSAAKSPPEHPQVIFADCTLVSPDNAVQLSYASNYARIKFVGSRLIALNFTQPEMGGKSTGIFATERRDFAKASGLHVDLEDTIVCGYSIRTPGPFGKYLTYSTKGRVQAYVQYKQDMPEGFERLGLWPTELFYHIAPPRTVAGLKSEELFR